MFGASLKSLLGRKFNFEWSIMHTYLPYLLTIWECVRTDVDRRPNDEKIILTYDMYTVRCKEFSCSEPA